MTEQTATDDKGLNRVFSWVGGKKVFSYFVGLLVLGLFFWFGKLTEPSFMSGFYFLTGLFIGAHTATDISSMVTSMMQKRKE